MAWSVQRKLAAILCLITLGICIAIYFAVRASFTEGFFGYLNASRNAEAQQLVEAIETQVQDRQQWQRFTRSPRNFHDLYRNLTAANSTSVESQQLTQQALKQDTAEFTPPPEKFRPRDFRRPPPPHHPRPARGGRRPGPANIPFTLLDETQQPFFRFDRYQNDWQTLALSIDNSIVGYVAVAPIQDDTPVADQLFIESQNRWFRIIALGSALLFALFAWPLSALLTRPLKTLSGAVEQLADRQYDTRVSVYSDDDFGRLAAEFNRMAEKLGEFDQRQRNWIADISHELRTPLAIMQAEIEAVQDGVRALTPELLQSLKAETLQLQQLVEDLHAIVINESDDVLLNLEPVDIAMLVEQQVELQQQTLDQKALSFTLSADMEMDSTVLADRRRLTQVIMNLLQNSIRYTDSPGHIVCSIAPTAGKLEISWQDSAPGVDTEHLPRLFDRLYRVESSRNRAAGGSGLGLAVCKAIVEQHNGTIKASSSSLGGLKIVITLGDYQN